MCHTNSDPAVGIHQHFLSQGLMPSSFNDRRTVSSETLSTTPCSTNLAANSCVVHFLRPAGGTPRANDIKIASPSSFSFLGRPHRCRSLSAPSRFPSTNRWRVRWTVGTLVCRTSAISRSILSSSARRRIWARLIFRLERLPVLTMSSKRSRSSSIRSTMYILFIAAPCVIDLTPVYYMRSVNAYAWRFMASGGVTHRVPRWQ